MEENGTFIHCSEKMQEIRMIIDQIADTDVTVFIQGESGVGKEVVARSIHLNSSHRENPFVKVNIAIAIGTLVDAAIVMTENVHRKLEHGVADERRRLEAVFEGCREVGPSLFFSLMIVALSFLPVFTLEAQEGRLFAPLAYTKTYAMVWASLLSITLVPVLIYWLVRGRIRTESANPVNRAAMAVYRPFLELALKAPWTVTFVATALVAATLWPASRLGSEFMPELDEGDLLYMPTTLPGLSGNGID